MSVGQAVEEVPVAKFAVLVGKRMRVRVRSAIAVSRAPSMSAVSWRAAASADLPDPVPREGIKNAKTSAMIPMTTNSSKSVNAQRLRCDTLKRGKADKLKGKFRLRSTEKLYQNGDEWPDFPEKLRDGERRRTEDRGHRTEDGEPRTEDRGRGTKPATWFLGKTRARRQEG
jgi:hypothetical protein